MTKVVQSLGFALYTVILFSSDIDVSKNTQQYIRDKAGMAFNFASIQCFAGVFQNLYVFIPAIPQFKRESQNRLYSPVAFYLTHTLFE